MCTQEARIHRNGMWQLVATAETREAALIAAAEKVSRAERRWIFVKLAGAWEYYFSQQNQNQTKEKQT
jgi:hypothetical protein